MSIPTRTRLKTSIKMLEQRKQRLLASLNFEGANDRYFAQSELDRIEFQIQEANLELARKTDSSG